MPDLVSSGACLAASELSGALTAGLWVMLAAVLAVGGISIAVVVRRWSQREQPPEAFTLQELREMRARNEISEQEFATLRAGLLGRSTGRSSPTAADAPDEP